MKVAVNKCWGGFTLSEEAVKLGRELSGDKNWGDMALSGEMYSDGSGIKEQHMKDCCYLPYGFKRNDPVLIKVIEELGEKASGRMAKINLINIPDGVEFDIDNYDGMETIHEKLRSW